MQVSLKSEPAFRLYTYMLYSLARRWHTYITVCAEVADHAFTVSGLSGFGEALLVAVIKIHQNTTL